MTENKQNDNPKQAKNPGIFTPGHLVNQKHGAAGAERALATGANFTGMAAAAEQSVRYEVETAGVSSIMRRDAIRLQTVADLLYQAILGADTLEKLDALIKRYGWIAAHALRAWQMVKTEEQAAGKGVSVSDVLDAIRQAKGDNNEA